LKGGYRQPFTRNGLNPEIIKYLKGSRKTDELISYYNNLVDQIFKEDSISDTLHDWTKNGPSYYGWKSVRYFLFEYELSLQEKSKTDRAKIDWAAFSKEDFQSDYFTVEHIYPQRVRSPYWAERFGALSTLQKRLLRNSLGNLLALSAPKNASLGNRPFPEKIGSTGTTVGYRFGSYSENEVSLSTDWTSDEIVERGIRMLNFMEIRWRLNIGDRSQKIKALGLQSILKRST